MARTDTLGNFLTDVAEAIRTKKGTTGTIPANTFDTEIANLPSGGETLEFTDASYMFYSKARFEQIDNILPLCNKATKMISMFSSISNYNSLLDISSLRTSFCTNMNSMFSNSNGSAFYNLDLSNFDTSKVTDMSSMFNGCSIKTPNLSSFNTSNVTNMNSMFSNNNFIDSFNISNFDTSNVTNMSNMFLSCRKLTNISKLNANKVVVINNFANSCTSLTDFGGLENLGQAYLTTQSANYYNYKLDLSTCTALTEQSLINVLNNLYDIATKGCKTQQVVLGTTNLEKLTSEEGQAALTNATAKGWTIS